MKIPPLIGYTIFQRIQCVVFHSNLAHMISACDHFIYTSYRLKRYTCLHHHSCYRLWRSSLYSIIKTIAWDRQHATTAFKLFPGMILALQLHSYYRLGLSTRYNIIFTVASDLQHIKTSFLLSTGQFITWYTTILTIAWDLEHVTTSFLLSPRTFNTL